MFTLELEIYMASNRIFSIIIRKFNNNLEFYLIILLLINKTQR